MEGGVGGGWAGGGGDGEPMSASGPRAATAAAASGAASSAGAGEGDAAATLEAAAVKALDNFGVALDQISRQLDPLFAVPWPTLMASLKDEERAKLCVTLAYTVNSLYYMFLRTKGVPTKNHRVQKELERVKGYMTKLQVIKAPAQQQQSQARPSLKVDTAASQRMVTAALAANQDGGGGGEGQPAEGTKRASPTGSSAGGHGKKRQRK